VTFDAAMAIIATAKSTPTTSVDGNRVAISSAPPPVPVPTSSARLGGSGSVLSPATYGSKVSGRRSCSHVGASWSHWRRKSGRSNRQAPGRATTASVTSRAKRRDARSSSAFTTNRDLAALHHEQFVFAAFLCLGAFPFDRRIR